MSKARERTMTTIPSLIEKLRGLKGPDREVDVAIVQAIYPRIGQCTSHCVGDDPIFWREPYYKEKCPPLTASLDAVTALIMREMPKCLCDMNTFGAAAIYPNWLIGDVDTKYAATAETPAIALLIAFLEAKMEMEK